MGLLLPLVPFLYSVLTVACLSSKFLHLAQHEHSVPLAEFLIYLPTLFFQDALVLCLGRLLLRGPDGLLQGFACALGGLTGIVTYGASAMQIGFYWETGSQIEWSASGSFLRDPAAMKILLSGMRSVGLSGAMLMLIAYLTTPQLYAMAGSLLHAGGGGLLGLRLGNGGGSRDVLPITTTSTNNSPVRRSKSRRWIGSTHRGVAVVIAVVLFFLYVRRPRVPYNHLASTLPFSLSAAFHKSPKHSCAQSEATPFPFPELVEPGRWERPADHYPGWVPDHDWPSSWPKWLPEHPPSGFSRWAKQTEKDGNEKEEHGCPRQKTTYNAATDPSKISNLDNDVYHKLQAAFDRNAVQIEHIVLLTLESARKETFPMKPGSELYEMVLDTFTAKNRAAGIDRLSTMTPTAQMLTGEFALNSSGKPNKFDDWPWRPDDKDGGGGINVQGALTGSSLTLKSLLSSHCGVMPLPVDLLEEAERDIYQPCIPHILELFNSKKRTDDAGTIRQFQERPWRSVFMQSSTDSYDRQALLTRRMGFNESITKDNTLDNPESKYYPPRSDEINYFGYAEEELAPYLREIIFDAAKNKTRLFLSHLTSTTHHPWRLPSSMSREQYFGSEERAQHRDLNAFFNTVHYVDWWVGTVLGYLDEAQIADRTLVVLVGDHGQAFEEDDWTQGTYENGHISNFRVPLVLRHPRLPRLDVAANATALAILPTILDLLQLSGSLNDHDRRIAQWLTPEYQGQSLVRPFKNAQGGRRSWNMGIINAGGSLLAVTSAGDPYRLVMPIQNASVADGGDSNDKVFEFRFTHTGVDPTEQHALERWGLHALVPAVASMYGADAARWAEDAAAMGRWWIDEQKRIWNYP